MLNKKPLVSVLIPVYGVEKYIEACAVSVFEQSYENIEVIFVNDCTKDRSIIILNGLINSNYKYLGSKIKIISHQENKGLAGSRNTALENAKGDFVFHLDSDDFINKNAIALLVNKALETSADIVFSDASIVYPNEVVVKVNKFVESTEDYLINVLLRKNNFNVWGNLYKRELYNEVRFYEGVNFGEDYATLPRILFFSKKNAYLNDVTYNYVQLNLASYTNNLKDNSIVEIFRGYDQMYDFFRLKNYMHLKIVDDAFYVLKSHMIKSSKGNKQILDCISNISSKKRKKYPKSNSIVNNVLNFLLDYNFKIVLIFFLKRNK